MESDDSSSSDSFKSDDQQNENSKEFLKHSSASNDEPGEDEKETLNISHQDLSDVSDLEFGHSSDEKAKNIAHEVKDLREKLDEKKVFTENSNGFTTKDKKNDEEVLDFEAEEGECNDDKEKITKNKDDSDKKIDLSEPEEGEELEEGEISEEDGKRPEENEPKPVCRFYTRGQCTWGMSCRFLHPGVTDKGNYTMFDMVRPVPMTQPGFPAAPHFNEFREARPPVYGVPHHPYAHVRPPISTSDNGNESAWERGLRTAKEMMRKASKRKEQDIDFEDKKMNLSLSQEEMEKDNYYIRDRAANEISPTYKSGMYSPGRPVHRPPIDEDSFGRVPRYRELQPPHRAAYYEDPEKRRSRPMREVIVQKADQWSDPWMRSKSPGARKRGSKKRDHRSYSSNSSYSSSDSSNSDSSSESTSSSVKHRKFSRHKSKESGKTTSLRKRMRTRSPTPKQQYSPTRKNISSPSKRYERRVVSPPIDRRYEKGLLTPKRKVPSPHKTTTLISNKKRDQSSSSNSESSESSESESDSSYSSSSESSDESTSAKHIRSRDKVLHERKIASKKVEMSKKRSPVVSSDDKSKTSGGKKSNRREELLKQLKAVEDAIARKRSKIN